MTYRIVKYIICGEFWGDVSSPRPPVIYAHVVMYWNMIYWLCCDLPLHVFFYSRILFFFSKDTKCVFYCNESTGQYFSHSGPV